MQCTLTVFVVPFQVQIPSSFSAEVMSHQGWDSLTIDMQHGVIDYPNALQMLQSISSTDVTPLARVNWNEPGQIMKILDAGCYGVICPMVSNKFEAASASMATCAAIPCECALPVPTNLDLLLG